MYINQLNFIPVTRQDAKNAMIRERQHLSCTEIDKQLDLGEAIDHSAVRIGAHTDGGEIYWISDLNRCELTQPGNHIFAQAVTVRSAINKEPYTDRQLFVCANCAREIDEAATEIHGAPRDNFSFVEGATIGVPQLPPEPTESWRVETFVVTSFDEIEPAQNGRLPIVRINGALYFNDLRLRQYRLVGNPHEFIDFNNVRWELTEYFGVELERDGSIANLDTLDNCEGFVEILDVITELVDDGFKQQSNGLWLRESDHKWRKIVTKTEINAELAKCQP